MSGESQEGRQGGPGAAAVSHRADAGLVPAAERLRLPGPDGGDPRRAAVHLPAVRGAREPAGLAPARARARATSTAWPSSPRTRRRCWRRTSASPPRAWCSSPSTPGSTPTRSAYILEHSGAKVLFIDREFESLVQAAPRRPPRGAHRRHRRPRRPLRGLPGRRLAGARASPGSRTSTRRSRSTTPRERPAGPRASWSITAGAYLNAIGETLETGLSFDARYLWTLPMFHCNGWCFTWGVTAYGATHVCLRRVEPGAGLGPDRRRGHHPLLRRPDRADRDRQRPQGPPARPPGDRRGGRRAALPDPARARCGSSASVPSTSTA